MLPNDKDKVAALTDSVVPESTGQSGKDQKEQYIAKLKKVIGNVNTLNEDALHNYHEVMKELVKLIQIQQDPKILQDSANLKSKLETINNGLSQTMNNLYGNLNEKTNELKQGKEVINQLDSSIPSFNKKSSG